MDGYRRPAIERGVFRDEAGEVIPYGSRWHDTPSEDLPYSVTAHPERFEPLRGVARALTEALPAAHRPGGAGLPVVLVETEFGGIEIHVASARLLFPVCGCDACDEDVEGLATQMEELVEAVVAGRFELAPVGDGYRYGGDWGARASNWSLPPQGRA